MSRDKLVLKFNDSHIDIVELSNGFSGISLKSAVSFSPKEKPDGINSFYCTEQNVKEFSELLKDNKIKSRRADIILSLDGIITRLIEVPFMKRRDLEKYIDKNKSEYFTVSINDYCFDYKILDIDKGEVKKLILLLVVFPKAKLKDIALFVETCGIKLGRINIYPDCISDLFIKKMEKSIAVFDISMEKSNVTILDEGKIFLYSGITFEPYGEMHERYEEIIENLGYFLNFYSSRHFGNKVDDIYIIGDLASDDTFCNAVEDQFSIEPIRGIRYIGLKFNTREDIDINLYGDIIACTIKSRSIYNKKIDLKKVLNTKEIRREMNITAIVGASLLMLTILWISYAFWYISSDTKKLNTDALTSRLAGLSTVENDVKSLNEEKKTYEARLASVNMIKDDAFNYISILDTLKNGLPKSVTVSKVALDKDKVDLTVNINKSTLDKIKLVIALNNIKKFEPIEIESIKLDDSETQASFTLKLKKQQ